MSADGSRTVPPTPAKEIANAKHRILLLRRALRAEPNGQRGTANTAEKLRLEDVRDGWQAEAEEIRRAHREHAARMWKLHANLAAEHRRRWRALRKLEQAGEVLTPDETLTEVAG
jgi:hypothetical protein